MNTYAIWGAPTSCKAGSLEDSFTTSGRNFGNILIGNGLTSNLSNAEIIPLSQARNSGDIKKCSRILIPAANFLWEGFDFGFLADELAETTLPITMIGLGSQSKDRVIKPKINAGTLRLIKLVSQRSPSIGVRGHYTAELLCSLGITNSIPLGCPSFYTKGNLGIDNLPNIPFEDSSLNSLRTCINGSRRVARHSFFPSAMQQAENIILQHGILRNSPFIAQDEIDEIRLARGNQDVLLNDAASYFSSISPSDVRDYFKSKTIYFTDFNPWSEFVRSYDLVLGTRFHGCLIALLSGTPSLLVVHDSRTLEMAEIAGIPYVLANQLNTMQDLEECVRSLSFELFKHNISALTQKFNAFKRDHGL